MHSHSPPVLWALRQGNHRAQIYWGASENGDECSDGQYGDGRSEKESGFHGFKFWTVFELTVMPAFHNRMVVFVNNIRGSGCFVYYSGFDK